jgi:SnoaL-like protein
LVEVKRSAELEQYVRASFEAVRSGDQQWFVDHTADAGDVLFYGTAPGEEYRGRDAVLALAAGQAQANMEESGLSEEENPEFECFEAGDTGWVVFHGNFVLADGSKVPVRGVTVVVRDGDDWKRVFGAVHALPPNELLAPGSPLAVRDS